MSSAGAPPVEGGEQIANQVRSDIAELREDLADAKTQVDQADPNSVAAIGRAVVAASNVLGALANNAQALGALLPAAARDQDTRELPGASQPARARWTARFSASTFTVGSPRKPKVRPVVCAATSARTSLSGNPVARATRGTCSCA